MPTPACGTHEALMKLVPETRAHLKSMGSSGASALATFNQKLLTANTCNEEYPGRPELIASCKAHTVNEALWEAGVRTGPIANATCNGRKGPTTMHPENWTTTSFLPQKTGGRKSRRSKNKSKSKKAKRASRSRMY